MSLSSSKKLRVAVLYGGRSGEHEVSLQSAASVIKNLDPDKFEIIPIGIDKQGNWLVNDIKLLPLDDDTKALKLQTDNAKLLAGPGQLAVNANQHLCDVVFPVLHGIMGEDGTMQGVLETANIPYVGPGVLVAAIGMDKDVSKRLVNLAGVAVGPYLSCMLGQWQLDKERFIYSIVNQLGLPVFVKPANTGSSVGINKVNDINDLANKINEAFQYDVKVVIEKAFNVREIEIAVLENNIYGAEPLVSVPGEVIPHHEFYSYEAKYSENGAELLIPAPLNELQLQQAQLIAKQVFTALECESMARVDLFLEKDSGKFYFNEINTIPGFTELSMYPKLWEATGLPYKKLLTHLIHLAMARHQRKRDLRHEFISN